MMKTGWILWVTGLIFLGSGCSFREPADTLSVISILPAEDASLPADEPIILALSDYIVEDGIDTSKIKLSSGDLEVGIDVGYDPVGPRILISGAVPLRPNLVYQLKVEPGAFTGLAGAELVDAIEVTRKTSSVSLDDMENVRSGARTDVDKTSQVSIIFERSCGCHGPEPKVFPNLDADDLIDTPSARQPGYRLIRRGKPLQSYLVLRLLRNYPGVYGMDKDLEPDEIRMIIDWISGL